ncbi:MAG: 8-oxo-dGTP diphosphatase [Myxococcota bacterium]
MRLADVDWAQWVADDLVTIVYVVQASRLLLIEKKRGLGRGKVNAPGGRVEPGESLAEAAARELQEEVGLTVEGPLDRRAECRYQFTDGLALHLHAFVTQDVSGRLLETDEALPFWVSPDDIPLDRMWEDNRLWVPQVLAGQHARGRFIFDGDAMGDHDLQVGPGLLDQ